MSTNINYTTKTKLQKIPIALAQKRNKTFFRCAQGKSAALDTLPETAAPKLTNHKRSKKEKIVARENMIGA
jgi:hypothetical protein